MKQPIPIRVPERARSTSYLYPEMDASELHQTVAVVLLENGFMIEAGWFPENDPGGRFVIEVSHSGETEQMIEQESGDPYDLALAISELADHYSGQSRTASR